VVNSAPAALTSLSSRTSTFTPACSTTCLATLPILSSLFIFPQTLFGPARRAEAEGLHLVPEDTKIAGAGLPGAHLVQLSVVKIHHRFAIDADQVMMTVEIGVQPVGAGLAADLAQQPHFHKRLDVLVNCGQGNRRDAPFHPAVNRLRLGVPFAFGQGAVDGAALMSRRQTQLGAAVAEQPHALLDYAGGHCLTRTFIRR